MSEDRFFRQKGVLQECNKEAERLSKLLVSCKDAEASMNLLIEGFDFCRDKSPFLDSILTIFKEKFKDLFQSQALFEKQIEEITKAATFNKAKVDEEISKNRLYFFSLQEAERDTEECRRQMKALSDQIDDRDH